MNYKDTYEKWTGSEYISGNNREILKNMTEEEIHEAFYKNAQFGTGGMRGVMGLGTNRINIYTVRMATKAFAEMLLAKVRGGGENDTRLHPRADGDVIKVVVAYDTRNNSREFAEETAKVFAAAGIKTYLFDRPSPVPLLSFAIRELGAAGGVVITASHNTKEYNGYKAYDETGCQLLPNEANIVAANMEALSDPLAVETMNFDDAVIDAGLIVPLGDSITGSFRETIKPLGIDDDSVNEELRVVYTPIHGSGRDYVMEVLADAGFRNVILTEEQAQFDGDFSTVKKPNPEDPKALEIAVKVAKSAHADIVIGTDPDCDRVGVALINADGSVTYLTGNQTGVLLIDYLSKVAEKTEDRRKLITTIVTGALGPMVARSHGIETEYVLTGFKYIGDVMNRMERDSIDQSFFMGYEESYGYLAGTHARDKDGISSALIICRMAAYYKAIGKSLNDVLKELYEIFGFWLDRQESLVFEGSEGEKTMENVMDAFRQQGKNLFEDFAEDKNKINYEDYLEEGTELPQANVLKYAFGDSSWVAVRPSGTEPKIKIYYCMRGENLQTAEKRLKEASAVIHRLTDKYQ